MENSDNERNPLNVWEGPPGLRRLAAFFGVFGAALFRPTLAYASEGRSARLGGALRFWLFAAALSLLLNALVQSAFGGMFNLTEWTFAAAAMLAALVCSTVGVAALSCYQHLLAALLGAGKNGLKASLRAFLYMHGALALLLWTPCVGVFLYLFWGFYLTVAALQAAHGVGALRAFLAAALAWGLLLALAAFAALVFVQGLIQLLAPSAPPMIV